MDLRIWGTGDTGYWFPSPRLQHPAPRQRGGGVFVPRAGRGPRPLLQLRDPDALQRSFAALQRSPSLGEVGSASFPPLWVWGWARGRGAPFVVPDRCPRGGAGVSVTELMTYTQAANRRGHGGGATQLRFSGRGRSPKVQPPLGVGGSVARTRSPAFRPTSNPLCPQLCDLLSVGPAHGSPGCLDPPCPSRWPLSPSTEP